MCVCLLVLASRGEVSLAPKGSRTNADLLLCLRVCVSVFVWWRVSVCLSLCGGVLWCVVACCVALCCVVLCCGLWYEIREQREREEGEREIERDR